MSLPWLYSGSETLCFHHIINSWQKEHSPTQQARAVHLAQGQAEAVSPSKHDRRDHLLILHPPASLSGDLLWRGGTFSIHSLLSSCEGTEAYAGREGKCHGVYRGEGTSSGVTKFPPHRIPGYGCHQPLWRAEIMQTMIIS